MLQFADAAVTDARAHALLTEYFEDRARSFPAEQGVYSINFPASARFTPPHGLFVLVLRNEDAVGCGGARQLDAKGAGAVRYEIKHLWIQPHARGSGAGRALLADLEARARALGATEVVLDTNSSLLAAGGLYRTSGYQEIAAYNDNPNATNWFRKAL
jgi:ribosomal protein S18 acetylase RimI-like enzyme